MAEETMGEGTTIELPANPYTVIRFEPVGGVVVTHQGAMSIDEAAALLVERLEQFASESDAARDDRVRHDLDDLLDVTSLVAEINLYLARALWAENAPASLGTPRMVSMDNEKEELRFIENLAVQRSLTDRELANHILEQGDFMQWWARMRRELSQAN